MLTPEVMGALRIVFDLANGAEITVEEAETDEALQQAIAQSNALDVIQSVLEGNIA